MRPVPEVIGDGNVGTRDARVAVESLDAERDPILVASAEEEPGGKLPGLRISEQRAQAERGAG